MTQNGEDQGFKVARRDLFAAGGAALLFTATPAVARIAPAVEGTGRKFFPDGRVHPFAGNTIVCHLDQQGPNSASFNQLLNYYRQFPVKSYFDKIAPLPPSSYHMTVFGGANNTDRGADKWPSGISPAVSMEECNRVVGERVTAAAVGPVSPISMRVDPADSGYDGNTLRIPLLPADEAEAQKLRNLRDRLSSAIGIRSPKHESYQFHITLGYLLRTFSRNELRDAEQDMRRWKAELATRVPVIELGQPEYCIFEDMFAFHRQFFI